MRKDDYQSLEKAKKYHASRFPGKGGKLIEQSERDSLIQFCKKYVTSQNRYLDYACGTGRISSYIVNEINFNEIILVDESEYMLEIAKSQVVHPSTKFLRTRNLGDLSEFSKVDLITTFHFIKHISNPADFFNAFSLIQEKNSILIFDFLNHKSIVKFRQTTCHLYGIEEIREMLRHSGYTIVDIRKLELGGESIYIKGGYYRASSLIKSIDTTLLRTPLKKYATKFIVCAQKQ